MIIEKTETEDGTSTVIRGFVESGIENKHKHFCELTINKKNGRVKYVEKFGPANDSILGVSPSNMMIM